MMVPQNRGMAILLVKYLPGGYARFLMIPRTVFRFAALKALKQRYLKFVLMVYVS